MAGLAFINRRLHYVTRGSDLIIFEALSVHEFGSNTARKTSPRSYISDAKNYFSSNSTAVINRIGSDGANLKMAALHNSGWDIDNCKMYPLPMVFETRAQAEDYRNNYIKNYSGAYQILGSSDFHLNLGNGTGSTVKHSFHQPISGNTKKATERVDDVFTRNKLTSHMELTIGIPPSTGSNFSINGSLYNLIYFTSSSNFDLDATDVIKIGNHVFQKGEFDTYGQLYKKMMVSGLVS